MEPLRLSNEHGEVVFYRFGAHVARYDLSNGEPVLWVSNRSRFDGEHPIRGGVPLCMPWFGPHPTDPKQPSHGYGRTAIWTLQEHAADHARLTLETEGPGLDLNTPCRFAATFRIELEASLHLELTIENQSDDSMPLTEALHSYFPVSDVRRVTVDGLEGAQYVDKVAGGERRIQADGPIRIAGQTDRVYLHTPATCAVRDPDWHRRIVIDKEGSRSTVVWNPWIDKAARMEDFGDDEWPGMICIEAANALDDGLTLAPGESHRLAIRLRREPL